jgi:peptide chain release factor 1
MEFAEPIVTKLREMVARFQEVSAQLEDPEVASDPKRFPPLLRERGSLEMAAELGTRLEQLITRRREAEEILETGDDEDLAELARLDLEGLDEEELALDGEIRTALVTEEDDFRRKIIMELRAGTGGDEASLFVGDLMRMYKRFVESQHWKMEILEGRGTDVGGYKEVIVAIQGDGAWRRLRFESGGHRVQRVPATETQGRIHTSAATVAVLAEAEDVDLNIRTEDLRIDTMRASGAGGQHVNKVESAVRITHLPTGVVVVCQEGKSQQKNKATAMRWLRTRLFEAERERLHQERAAERKSQVGSGDRSARVRTYNWPQNRVTDHRLGENFSLEQVVSGKLDGLLDALEAWDREQRIRNL